MIAATGGWAESLTPDQLLRLRVELAALYETLDWAVAEHAPACALSGRCCRFREYGHTLFLSEPEAVLLVADAPRPVRPLDAGESCPWQDAQGRCTSRSARPLACRVFYCDPRFETAAQELSETFLSRLKQSCEIHGWPWNYAPLHKHLDEALRQGRLATAGACSDGELKLTSVLACDPSPSRLTSEDESRT
jgi:hypothetical protein